MNTPGYEIFEHTADVGVRAFGSSWSQLLTNAARGMFSLIVEPEKIRPVESRAVDVQGDGREELLMNWLKALLCLFDIDGLLLSEFEIQEADEHRVHATVRGEPL